MARPGVCVDEDRSSLQILRASKEGFEACFKCRNLGGDKCMKPPPGATGQTEFKFIGLGEIDERRSPLAPTVADWDIEGAFFDVASHNNRSLPKLRSRCSHRCYARWRIPFDRMKVILRVFRLHRLNVDSWKKWAAGAVVRDFRHTT